MNIEKHSMPEVVLVLCKGLLVAQSFYDELKKQVMDHLPGLERGEKYTLEKICSGEFWKLLSNGNRRLAGQCMAHMVRKGFLPLAFAPTKHEYPKMYMLK